MILRISDDTGSSARRICAVLAAPRSTFYHAKSPTPSQLSDQQMGAHIERIFRAHRRRYGYRRIVSELSDEGRVCAPARVRRLMAQRGLRAIAPKHFLPKTSDGRADAPSPNLLLDAPLPTQKNRVFAGDITFIPTATGWLYLAVVIDLYSRKVVGWALADHMRSQLVIDALRQALGSRSGTRDAIFHSDRGSQDRQHRFPLPAQSRRPPPKHVRTRQSLPQRLDRKPHRHPQNRDAPRRLFQRLRRCQNRALFLHRLLLQHPPKTLRSRIPFPVPIRVPFISNYLNKFGPNIGCSSDTLFILLRTNGMWFRVVVRGRDGASPI